MTTPLSDDLLKIQQRPAMYLGSSEPLELVWELLSNSIDEFLAGRATRIGVLLEADGSVIVDDDGGGIPMEGGENSIAVRALTTLHLEGTLDGHGPHVHVEPNCVGLVVVNALSSWVSVTSRRDGVSATLRCEGGHLVDGPRREGPTELRGTRVAFLPDPKLIPGAADLWRLRDKLSTLAVLCPGLVIDLEDRRVQTTRFHVPAGVSEWPKWSARQPIGEQIQFDAVHGSIRVRGALRWVTQTDTVVEFVNLLQTNPGSGKNRAGLIRALREAAAPHCGAGEFDAEVFTSGLEGVVQVVMEGATLGDPNRRRLDSPEAAEAVHAVVAQAVSERLDHDHQLQRMFSRRAQRGLRRAEEH